MTDKREFRRLMRLRRKAVTAAERTSFSAALCANLLTRPNVRAAISAREPIAVYLALPDEIDLTPFITAALERGASLVAPRWNGSAYELAPLRSLDALVAGPHAVLEPSADAGEAVSPALPAVWLIPGLAFTRSGKRLGYGGGWYDRFLVQTPPASEKLGVAYPFQLVDDLPTEPHDILLSGVIC